MRSTIYLSSAFHSQSRYYHKTGVISLFFCVFFPILCFLRGLFCSMGEKMTQTKKNSNIKSRHIRVNCVHFSTRSRHIAAKQSWRLLPVGTIGPHKFDVFWKGHKIWRIFPLFISHLYLHHYYGFQKDMEDFFFRIL